MMGSRQLILGWEEIPRGPSLPEYAPSSLPILRKEQRQAECHPPGREQNLQLRAEKLQIPFDSS